MGFIHSNTTSEEFVAYLRDAAIKQGAPPQILWAIDNLGSVESLEAELEQTGGELGDCELARDDLREELRVLVNAAIDKLDPIPAEFIGELRVAVSALERHGASEAEIATLRKALA